MPFKSVVDQIHIVTPSLSSLQGLNIPNPAQNQGSIVHVVETGNFYGLVLDSDAAVDGTSVLPSILGGASRWMLLNIAKAANPPGTSSFFAFGRVGEEGVRLSGERFSSERFGLNEYLITMDPLPIGVVPNQLVISCSPRIASSGAQPWTTSVQQEAIVLMDNQFRVFAYDRNGNPTPVPFDFEVIIGQLFPVG